MPVQIGLSEILLIIGFLVALDNIITQVIKKALYEKVYGNVIALVVGVVITVFFGLAYCSYKAIMIQWYYVPALIIGGFMVAYGSMFGYNALKDTLDWKKKLEDKKD